MKIAVVAPSPVPLRTGGAERLWDGLVDHLGRLGHSVELLKLPVREYTLVDLVESYRQFAELDLSHLDLVISGKYPAWMVDHPYHVVYMLHPLRGLYERYPEAHLVDARLPDHPAVDAVTGLVGGTERDPHLDELVEHLRTVSDDLGSGHEALAVPGPLARSVVQFLDRVALHPRRIRRHFAISHHVAGRPGYFPPGAAVEVVYPPAGIDPGPSRLPGSTGGGPLLVSVGRLESIKRHDLVVEAMRYVETSGIRLVIVGDGPERERLVRQAASDPRVEVEGGLDDAALVERFRDASVVLATPEDEDLGYVGIEAMLAARPVITCTDSGGVAELVGADQRGLVVDPDPRSIASAVDRLVGDRALATRLGDAGRRFAERITWDEVVGRLVAPSGVGCGSAALSDKPRVVMLSTYPVLEGLGGGSRRARALAESLTAVASVEIVSVATDEESVREVVSGDGRIEEVLVPRSSRHIDAESELRVLTRGPSVTDMAAAALWPSSPQLVREIRASCMGADLIVLAHPYLVDAAREVAPDAPLLYDAHNHEVGLKDQILPATEAGDWWRSLVRRVETTAVIRAEWTIVPTEDERTALVAMGGRADRVSVVPNGVDVERIAFTTGAERVAATRTMLGQLGRPIDSAGIAVFVGSGHPPNLAAAERIAAMAPHMPLLQFLIVGRCGELLERDGTGDNVHVTGRIPDTELDAIMAAGTVALNPVSVGGGSNLKVIEAMAAGMPVVTTRVGARGVPPTLLHLVGLQTFRQGIDQVLSNPDATSDRVERARDWVVSERDWSIVMKDVVGSVAARMAR